MIPSKIKVGIIGLGQIGLKYDLTNDYILTYLKAFILLKDKFEVLFVLDHSLESIKKAKKNYPGIMNFYSDENQIKKLPDILVLCASEYSNIKYFEKYIKSKEIRIIQVEKPFKLNNAWEYNIYKDKIRINYFRKNLPIYNNLKKLVQKKYLGNFKQSIIVYSKSFENSCSHYLHLIHYLLDIDLKNISLEYSSPNTENPFVNFKLMDSESNLTFIPNTNKDAYSIEMNLYFSNYRIEITDYERKIRFYKLKKDVMYSNYNNYFLVKELNSEYQIRNTMSYVISDIYANFKNINRLKLEDFEVNIKINHLLNKVANYGK